MTKQKIEIDTTNPRVSVQAPVGYVLIREDEYKALCEQVLKYREALCSIEAGYGTIYHVPHDGSDCAEIAREALGGSE